MYLKHHFNEVKFGCCGYNEQILLGKKFLANDAGVVPESESLCDYVSADSEVVATKQLPDDDIVRAVNKLDETSDDRSVDEWENNMPTASEALDTVDMWRRCCFGAHEGGEEGANIAAAAERAIVHIRKMHQCPITDFFAAKSVWNTSYVF